MRLSSVLILITIILGAARLASAQSTPTPTPELSVMVTVVPPGSEVADAQDAVMVFEVSDGDVLIAALIFALVVLLLLNFVWDVRRARSSSGALALVVVLLCAPSVLHAQSGKGQWCGYALIEGVPDIGAILPILSRLTEDEQPDSSPADLYQTRPNLAGDAAIIEGCWIVFPSRDLIVNWLSLNGDASRKESLDQAITYSLFAPDGSREDSAASARQYLSEHIKDWEVPEG